MASKQPTAAALLVLAATTAYAGDTSLTVYNGGFGVVRETFPLSLKPGENKVVFADATAQVEASSVILRDAQGLDYRRIAEVLDIPEGTVKSRLFRSRFALRQELERLEAQPDESSGATE